MISKQLGVTLVEVMIAVVILAMAALSAMKLQSYVEQKADFAKRSLEAMHLAQSQLERFRQRGMTAPISSYTLLEVHNECNAMTKQSAAVSIQLSCKSQYESSNTLSHIEIRAYWLDRLNLEQQIVFITMLSSLSEFDSR